MTPELANSLSTLVDVITWGIGIGIVVFVWAVLLGD